MRLSAGQCPDAKQQLGQRDAGQVQGFRRLVVQPSPHGGVWLRLHRLEDDVGIQDDHSVEGQRFGRRLVVHTLEDGEIFIGQPDLSADGVPAWLLVAAVNMWVGVAHAGYSAREEFPILLLVFAVPAVAAGIAV